MANNIIGERIAGLLREQGKTQRELAEQVGTTEVSISRYIKGDRVPKGPVLANIARNANRWSKKQKLDLVSALFENND